MNHQLAIGMQMSKGNGSTAMLLFCLKGLEILHQEIRGREHHSDGTLQRHSRPQDRVC